MDVHAVLLHQFVHVLALAQDHHGLFGRELPEVPLVGRHGPQCDQEELEQEGIVLPEIQAPITKRCIHTSADFDYARNLCFSPNAVEKAMEAIKQGACIVTDTQMAKSGINKRALARYGGEVYCFMSDEDVA